MAEDDDTEQAARTAEQFHRMEIEYDRSEAHRLVAFARQHHLTFEVDHLYHCMCGAGPFPSGGFTLHVLAEWHEAL